MTLDLLNRGKGLLGGSSHGSYLLKANFCLLTPGIQVSIGIHRYPICKSVRPVANPCWEALMDSVPDTRIQRLAGLAWTPELRESLECIMWQMWQRPKSEGIQKSEDTACSGCVGIFQSLCIFVHLYSSQSTMTNWRILEGQCKTKSNILQPLAFNNSRFLTFKIECLSAWVSRADVSCF